jgi:predicted nucleotidyltransferase component of viral defense system
VIPKAEILEVARETALLPTTVEKDYALGWVLAVISEHPDLGQWLFKGGTCLKKCYFDTYRFSEDLDFTIPDGVPYDVEAIRTGLTTIAEQVHDRTGVEFPFDGIDLRESVNKRGEMTFRARMTFSGPLQLARAERQRIRFDLTRDERIVDHPEAREVFHSYSDAPRPPARVQCYSLNEVLGEKLRALVERSGRARDLYDVVNVGRNLRSELSPTEIVAIATEKFRFKDLPDPTPDGISRAIDPGVLETDWGQSLRHQLPVLPPADEFLAALDEVLDWLFGVEAAPPALPTVPGRPGETGVPPVRFALPTPAAILGRGAPTWAGAWPAETFGSRMDRVRYGARNRLLVRINYHGVSRLVEPYSLRVPKTGNLLLYVFEVQRGGGPGGGIKAFKVAEIGNVEVTAQPFQPQYRVEL